MTPSEPAAASFLGGILIAEILRLEISIRLRMDSDGQNVVVEKWCGVVEMVWGGEERSRGGSNALIDDEIRSECESAVNEEVPRQRC
jgi:hypothetical protein